MQDIFFIFCLLYVRAIICVLFASEYVRVPILLTTNNEIFDHEKWGKTEREEKVCYETTLPSSSVNPDVDEDEEDER